MSSGMDFGLLGPLAVCRDGVAVRVPPGKPRVLLAGLLLKPSRLVRLDELSEALWGPSPPGTARVTLQNYVMRVRKSLGDDRGRIITQPGGYLISVTAGELDVTRCAVLLGSARVAVRNGSWDVAAGQARSALALWRGEPLEDVESELLALREVPRLEEMRLQAYELRIGAELHLGGHAEVIGELQHLTSAHPLREHLHALLMLALYRGGRQAEALASYQFARGVLVDELGLEPGPELRELHQRILNADPVLAVEDTTRAISSHNGLNGADVAVSAPLASARGMIDFPDGGLDVFRELDTALPFGPEPATVELPRRVSRSGHPHPLPAAAADPADRSPAPAGGAPDGPGAGAGRAWPASQRPAARGAFVGRKHELAVLTAAAAAASHGEPQVVLVEGEAGIGKSTLLVRFASAQANAAVLRASGDEAEVFLPYGITSQLVAGTEGNGRRLQGLLASDLSEALDPLDVGAELGTWLSQLGRGRELVLVVIDDLQWADTPSARALLFAVRRLQTERVLIVVSARAGGLSRLGEGWRRFLAGDHRADRIRLAGLEPEDMVALAKAMGVGTLSRRAADRLLAETGGNLLYCRAVLEEPATFMRLGEPVRVPRSLAELVLSRADGLSPAARELVAVAAVLGQRCRVDIAAELADLSDPLPALEEATTAGMLIEQPGTARGEIGFTHLLLQRAIYGSLSLARRRELHQRAAGLVDQQRALGHRLAAATGPDDTLAAQLEAAGQEALGLGRTAQAANWLAQAATVSSDPAVADRRLLDALETLVIFGEIAEAEALATRVRAGQPTARRSCLLGMLDYQVGQAAAAEGRLVEAWQRHDPDLDPFAGCAAALWLATLCLSAGRFREAIDWAERGASVDGAPIPLRHAATGVLAITLFNEGHGAEGLDRLAFLPAAPGEVPQEESNTLVLRGMAKGIAEDLTGAIADLSTAAARLHAGLPLTTASICLTQLASAEFRIGSWDDAVAHAELALSLAYDAGRVLDLAGAHSIAALVPAARGDWAAASTHVQLATQAAQAAGETAAIGTATVAQAHLAMAQGDLGGVVHAAAANRAVGMLGFFCLAHSYDWRWMEIEAFIGLGDLSQAERALAGMEADLSAFGPPSARMTAARLRADLATATGKTSEAAAACDVAWQRARHLRAPLPLAQLEISDARRLRAAGQPEAAGARLTSARQRLAGLGARPYLQLCERELAAISAP